jgi:hypothetical protein
MRAGRVDPGARPGAGPRPDADGVVADRSRGAAGPRQGTAATQKDRSRIAFSYEALIVSVVSAVALPLPLLATTRIW